MRNLVAQIRAKDGLRFEKLVLDHQGLSIGRAWNSDIIVQDRFVDPDHLGLSLDEDLGLLITDFDTVNGSKLLGKSLVGAANPYRFGDLIVIGDTQIRLYDAESAVADTPIRSRWFGLAERFSSVKALVVLTVMAVLADLFQSYSTSTTPLKLEDFVVTSFGVLMLILVWSLVFGFLARLIRGSTNVRPLWMLACLAIVLANIVALLLLFLRFNLQDIYLGEDLTLFISLGLSVLLLFGVFSYVSHFSIGQKWLYSLVLVVCIFALLKSDDYLKTPSQRWRAWTDTEQATLPPEFLFRDRVTLDAYLEKTSALFETE